MANGGIFGSASATRGRSTAGCRASNDYIFAIVGEELGLIGCALVLALFALFAVAVFRMIRKHRRSVRARHLRRHRRLDPRPGAHQHRRRAADLPRAGRALPFMSQGGTSLLSVLLACGVLLSFARTLPAPSPAVPVRS
jgi:cell division protein FtsW